MSRKWRLDSGIADQVTAFEEDRADDRHVLLVGARDVGVVDEDDVAVHQPLLADGLDAASTQ